MSSTEELACVYSSLILFDDDISITAEKLQTILKTANVEIEPYWPTLFAKALEGVDIKSLVTNISSGVGSGAPAAGSAAPAAGTFHFLDSVQIRLNLFLVYSLFTVYRYRFGIVCRQTK